MSRATMRVVVACIVFSAFATVVGHAQQKPAPPAPRPAQTAAPVAAPDKALMGRVLDAWSTLNTANVERYYDQAPGSVFYDLAPLKFVGFKEYEAGVKPMMDTLNSLKFTLHDDAVVHPAGALAWGTATVTTAMEDKAGKVTSYECRWTVIWQRRAAGWVIVHDHFSTPLPEAK